MENGVVNGGKKGKRQGIEGTANANYVCMDDVTHWIFHYRKMWSPFFLSFDRISPSSL
jgi:hypothetical protein